MPTYAESYIGRLRKLVGKEKLIVVAVRAVIRDAQGQVLFVRRSDNARWVMPSGALELGESLFECLQRETREECGLNVLSATPMAIYTYPDSLTAYGDPYYQLSVQFLVDEWEGDLLNQTDETTQARFFPIKAPPEGVASHYAEVLADLQSYDGTFILK